MPIITRKIELYLHHDAENDPDKTKHKKDKNYFWQINDNLYKAANCIVSHLFFNDEYENRLKIKHKRFNEIEKCLSAGEKNRLNDDEVKTLKQEQKQLYVQFKEERQAFLGTSEQNSTYQVVSNQFLSLIPSDILTNLNQSIFGTYREYRKEIRYGKRTLPNFKQGLPIPFSISRRELFLKKEEATGRIYLKWFNGIEWDLIFGRDCSNNREIVERIFSGVYKACNSSIQEKNKKIFLNLVVDIPESENNLDPDVVMGVDLGINTPLYLALNNNSYAGQAIGSREHFLKVRERMVAQKRQLQRSLATTAKGGRGRGHKLQALELCAQKERNWVHTQNHQFSGEVIKYALQNKVGVIQMEGLNGFGKDKEDNLLQGFKYVIRYWSYYELQTMIEYKAKKEGIKIRYIDPYHTSQTCSFCGYYEKGQRISQSVFVCKNPDCKVGKGKLNSKGEYTGVNADWNAARNIAISTKIVDRIKK